MLEHLFYKYVSFKSDKAMVCPVREKLTSDEKRAIDDIWKKVLFRKDYGYWEMSKAAVGFDACYVSEGLYNPVVRRGLNPYSQTHVFENKLLYDYFFSEIERPHTIFKNIFGQYYDANGRVLTEDVAIGMAKEYERIIVKPGIDSDSGRGVKLVRINNETDIDTLRREYKENYIVQEVITQSAETAVFNPQSVNTLRITTLNLNGHVTVQSPVFRFGQNGSHVDNIGAGGIMVGINDNGVLNEYGFDFQTEKHFKTTTGIALKCKKIHGYSDAVEVALRAHAKFPTVHLIGWDFAIDEHHKPIMIEVNISYPGIYYEQLCSGPLFGERTEEVIDYVSNHLPGLVIKM